MTVGRFFMQLVDGVIEEGSAEHGTHKLTVAAAKE